MPSSVTDIHRQFLMLLWLPLVGSIAADLAVFIVVLTQLRHRFPERAATYTVEVSLCFIGMAVACAVKGGSALWAAAPAAVFGLGIIAGRGSVATLVIDAGYEDCRTPEAEQAQRRFVRLLLAVVAVGALVAFIG
jgi:hypothetical protein